MPASLEIDEANGSTGVVTHAIANSNYGSADLVTLTPENARLSGGQRSYQKWQRFHIVSAGGARVEALKFYATEPAAFASHLGNVTTSSSLYASAGHVQTVYDGPSTGATNVPELIPHSEPSGANLGIGGVLTGAASSDGVSSDYLVTAVSLTTAAIAGATIVNTYQWDEIAAWAGIALPWAAVAAPAIAELFRSLGGSA